MMRAILPQLFVLLLFSFAAEVGVLSASVTRPNVLLFLVDDMGLMDTSAPMLTDEAGNPQRHPLNDWYRTPNMERLAAQGVRFSNFYSHNVCSPTRVSIMTGQNSARHRCTDYINPWRNNRQIDNTTYPLEISQQGHRESVYAAHLLHDREQVQQSLQQPPSATP